MSRSSGYGYDRDRERNRDHDRRGQSPRQMTESERRESEREERQRERQREQGEPEYDGSLQPQPPAQPRSHRYYSHDPYAPPSAQHTSSSMPYASERERYRSAPSYDSYAPMETSPSPSHRSGSGYSAASDPDPSRSSQSAYDRSAPQKPVSYAAPQQQRQHSRPQPQYSRPPQQQPSPRYDRRREDKPPSSSSSSPSSHSSSRGAASFDRGDASAGQSQSSALINEFERIALEPIAEGSHDGRRKRSPSEGSDILALDATELTVRKEAGRQGAPIRNLSTNFFQMVFTRDTIYRYRVTFEPEIPARSVIPRRRRLISMGAFLREDYNNWIYDGTGLVSTSYQADIHTYRNNKEESVTITYMKSIDAKQVNSPEVQMSIQLLSLNLLRLLKLIRFQQYYYYPEPIQLSYNISNLNIFNGFQAIVTSTTSGMYLNISLAHRVVQKSSIRAMINRIETDIVQRNPIATQYELAKLMNTQVNNALKGLYVIAMHNKRIWRIDVIDYTKSANHTFQRKDGSQISYYDYFLQQYGEKWAEYITDPTIPGMIANIQRTSTIHLPPELCYPTGVTDEMRSDHKIMKALSDITRMDASTRMGKARDLITTILSSPTAQTNLPLLLSREPLSIEGRLLGPFQISFQNKSFRVDGTNRQFSSASRDGGIYSKDPVYIRDWICIHAESDEREATRFCDELMSLGSRQGARVSRPTMIPAVSQSGDRSRTSGWKDALDAVTRREQPPQFVLFFIPGGDGAIYSCCKHLCTTVHGFDSQCVSNDTLRDPKKYTAVAGNLFKQVIAKLGYELWRVPTVTSSLPQNTMMVGIDVCHDQKLKTTYYKDNAFHMSVSTVGFCASYDEHYTRFNSFIAEQVKGEEYVRLSRELMRRAIQAYTHYNKRPPTNILVYRDGVGDSQLVTFVRREIAEFKSAFADENIPNVKLTVIVVQKRLSTRLYQLCPLYQQKTNPTSGGYGSSQCPVDGRCRGQLPYHSPQCGVVVDTQIVSPIFSDFFLVATAAPPGATARPTRYIIVRDDMELSSDVIQAVTHQCCYMFYNWTGPIRVPAAVMYAHKLAYIYGRNVQAQRQALGEGRQVEFSNMLQFHANLNGKLFFL